MLSVWPKVTTAHKCSVDEKKFFLNSVGAYLLREGMPTSFTNHDATALYVEFFLSGTPAQKNVNFSSLSEFMVKTSQFTTQCKIDC